MPQASTFAKATADKQEARGAANAARSEARRGSVFVPKTLFSRHKKRRRAEARLRVCKNWGPAQLSNPPPIGARTRIPLDAEKINSKKRLFYALLPSKYRKN